MKTLISLCVVASLLVFSGLSLAADKLKLSECGKDKKDTLTLAEAQACWPNSMDEKKFKAIDANNDGKLTSKELKAYRKQNK